MTLKVYGIEDVMELSTYSRASIDRFCEETRQMSEETRQQCNAFPLPFTQKGRRLLWSASAIEEWIEFRQFARPPVNVPPVRQKSVAKDKQRRQEATNRALERHGLNRKKET